LNHEEAQEAVQETVVAVAKSIGAFRYDRKACAFKTWLLRVTCSKIANQLARRARHPGLPTPAANDDTDGTWAGPEEQTSPWEQEWDEEWRRNLMEAALRRVKEKVSIEQYQMFDLFVNKQWEAHEVARTLKVTIGHVYVAKHRVSKLIRKEIETLEKQRP
jgi:RNA polymerase sigma-70 factor (ECF subfamily)